MSLYRKIVKGVDHWIVSNGKTTVEVSHEEFKRLWAHFRGVVL
jgi:hypothetical protein